MQRHRWAIDVIWFLTVHLCPIGPRVLDTCSLIYRAIHIREVYGTPLSQSLIQSYFLGPQTSLRFYLLSCTYAMLLLYLRLCEEHTVLFRNCDPFSRYRQAQSHFRVPSRLQPAPQTLSPSRSRPVSLRVYSKGWPPEIFLNPVIALS